MSTAEQTPPDDGGFIELAGPAVSEISYRFVGVIASKLGAVASPHVGFKGPGAPKGGEMWVEPLPDGDLLVLAINVDDGAEVYALLFPGKARIFADTKFPVSRAQALMVNVADPALDRFATVEAIVQRGRSDKALREAREQLKRQGPGAQPVDAIEYVIGELRAMLANYDPNRRPWQMPASRDGVRAFVAFIPAPINPQQNPSSKDSENVQGPRPE